VNSKIRRYQFELLISLAIYAVLVFGSNWLLRLMNPEGAVKYAIAVLPMFGVIAMAAAILRHVRRLDELQQRSTLEALAFAFSVSAFGFFAWGFAETAGAPRLPTFAIWPIMAVLWMVGGLLAHRRYR
jgi:hypothetical protein